MNRLWDLQQWRDWWRGLTPGKRLWPLAVAAAYWAGMAAIGGLRTDLFVSSFAPLVLYYLGPRLHPVLQLVLPLCLCSVLYDSQRYYADFIRGPIHVREPYEFDKRFFGITTARGVLTPNEWWQLHTHPVLDFLSGVAYIVFIPLFFVQAALMRFWYSRKGTATVHARSILHRSPQVMWGFLWLNILGWSTYYWYAASPPWYAELYGFGPARTDIPANLAGCARFDALIGFPLFQEWYGKSADVHGAIPSLHIAYPLMMVYYAFRFGAMRVFSTIFFLWISFAAVYLNHHYVLDILWGSVYAVGVSLVTDLTWNWNLKRKGVVVPGPDPEAEPVPALQG